MKIRLSQKEMREYVAARNLLSGTQFDLVEAATIAKTFAEHLPPASADAGTPKAPPVRGGDTFGEVFEHYLQMKKNLRPRTCSDYRQRCRRLLAHAPKLRRLPLSRLCADDCAAALDAAFPTPRQAVKGRALMSAVFAFGERLGLISRNPIKAIGVPVVVEKEILPLKPSEAKTLVNTARKLAGTRAALAVGLMVYAGIRPAEAARLCRSDADLSDAVICIAPARSKTGGARHVTIFPPLMRLFLAPDALPPRDECRLVPADWTRKWRHIRRACGWGKNSSEENPWRQDVLRHTFASYHLKHFRDITKLQLEMGHCSPKLLFARYVNLRGVTRTDAAAFFR